jgi:hypothetical protein
MASTGKQSTMLFGVQVNASISQPIIKDITLVVRRKEDTAQVKAKFCTTLAGSIIIS